MQEQATRLSKHNVLGTIEGFYAAQAAYHLHRAGLFRDLARFQTVRAVAEHYHYDEGALRGVLEFLYQATDILVRRGLRSYRLNNKYRDFYYFGFQLEKFIGAYGPTTLRLEEALRSPTLGRDFVLRELEAKAYMTIESPPNPVVLVLAKKLRIQSLLDLGCGPATLLTELCKRNGTFRGWGIDESGAMCRVARKRIAQAKLASKVRIVHGDARNLGQYFGEPVRRGINALQSKGLFNELFREGDDAAIDYLVTLRSWFPGKLLFVVDYYGKLTLLKRVRLKYRHTLVHDLIQVLTAQGVPPRNLGGWTSIYRRAGCSLEHAYEGDSQGIEWFVHVVKL